MYFLCTGLREIMAPKQQLLIEFYGKIMKEKSNKRKGKVFSSHTF